MDNEGIDVHTDVGVKTLLNLPTAEVKRLFTDRFGEGYTHLWDAMWIWRITLIQQRCSKGTCPKENVPPWGEADTCTLSLAIANTVRVFIETLSEKIAQIDPPPIYPDLLTVLKRVQRELRDFTQGIEADE